jgi:hypothetical protein
VLRVVRRGKSLNWKIRVNGLSEMKLLESGLDKVGYERNI